MNNVNDLHGLLTRKESTLGYIFMEGFEEL